MGGVASPLERGVAPVSGSTEHSGEDALATLISLVEADLEACNRVIVARMNSPVALIPQLAAHIVAAGGKRLRPLLTLASASLCGYPEHPGSGRHVDLAACVEFIHTATLLHDDVVDESQLRRGLASANAVFGNKASVLVGDFLFARAFQLMVEDGSLKVLAMRARQCRAWLLRPRQTNGFGALLTCRLRATSAAVRLCLAIGPARRIRTIARCGTASLSCLGTRNDRRQLPGLGTRGFELHWLSRLRGLA